MTAAISTVIAARGVTKVYGSGDARVEALRGVDLTVAPGEFVAVMGPSGSGKSTLLHLLAGLDRPTGGSLRVGAFDLGALTDDGRTLLRRRSIGVVFQAFNLLEVLSAVENVALPLTIAGCPDAEARRRARRALALVGLAGRQDRRPGELSGGEQQRVAIARALVIDPLVLLADEPTGNLDSDNGGRLVDLLHALAHERRQTTLMVTHDQGWARQAHRVLVLRDGRVATAEAAHPTRPAHPPEAA